METGMAAPDLAALESAASVLVQGGGVLLDVVRPAVGQGGAAARERHGTGDAVRGLRLAEGEHRGRPRRAVREARNGPGSGDRQAPAAWSAWLLRDRSAATVMMASRRVPARAAARS